MKYNINHERRVIIFWLPKSGVISLVKWMIHLKGGVEVNAGTLAEQPPPEIYRYFHSSIREMIRPDVDYAGYTKLFFGRNPYHRILSCYMDKYVCQTSVTPKDQPSSRCYHDFLAEMADHGLTQQGLRGVADFGHFCHAKSDIGWQFYEDLGRPRFDYISILPETGIPEGHLTHHYENIKEMCDMIGVGELYDEVRVHFEGHDFSHDLSHSDSPTMVDGLSRMSVDDLQQYMKPSWVRRLDYKSFYDLDTQAIFDDLYSPEFDFYRENGHSFQL